jgi:hypothetical protein
MVREAQLVKLGKANDSIDTVLVKVTRKMLRLLLTGVLSGAEGSENFS